MPPVIHDLDGYACFERCHEHSRAQLHDITASQTAPKLSMNQHNEATN